MLLGGVFSTIHEEQMKAFNFSKNMIFIYKKKVRAFLNR